MTDEQAIKLASDPRLETVARWTIDPERMAELEATTLLTALEEIKNTATPLAKEIQGIKKKIGEKRANTERLRAEIDALSRQGMGEILALERETGVWVDPFMAGFMKSVRKAMSDVGKFVLTPKGYEGLKKFEKYTIRPTAKEAVKGIAILDKYVPGWSVILDVITVLPGGILFSWPLKMAASVALAKARGIDLEKAFAIAAVTNTIPYPGRYPSFTIAKGTQTWISTKGSLLTKLRATGTEAVQSLSLVLMAAAMVAAPPAILALQALAEGLKAGLSVLNAQEAAKVLKKQARAIRAAGNAELAKIEEEERQTLAEIAKLRANIEAIKRQRMMIVRPSLSPAAPRDVITQTAESLGVSETAMIAGGLALIGCAVLVVSLRESE